MPSIVFTDSYPVSGYGSPETRVRVSYTENYDSAANASTVTVTDVQISGSLNYGTQVIHGRVTVNGTAVVSFGPGQSASNQASVNGTWNSISLSPPQSYGSVVVSHAADGSGSFTLALTEAESASVSATEGYFGFLYENRDVIGLRASAASRSVTLTPHPRASTIASCPAKTETASAFSLTVNRGSTDFYHVATFTCGSTELYASQPFGAAMSFTVPRTWFSAYPSSVSLTVKVSVQTYTGSDCATAVGSAAEKTITVQADAGMRPTVASGWVSAAPYNTGAVASMSGYIKGYSQARITFAASRITHAAGASAASYSIVCQGVTDSASPYLTPVLTSTSVKVRCTVTDTRGRSASATLSLAVTDYAAPSLSNISVFRCNSSGTADPDGLYYSVRAAHTYSSLGGQNSCSFTAAQRKGTAAYGIERDLTDNVARVVGTISADASYTVRITATDSLGNTALYYAPVPSRKWAMKFRPGGEGVAFGKTAEYDAALEIPADWQILRGGTDVFGGVRFQCAQLVGPGTLELAVGSSNRGLIVVSAARSGLKGAYIYNSVNAGTVTVKEISAAPELTVTPLTGALSLQTAQSNTVFVMRIYTEGSLA